MSLLRLDEINLEFGSTRLLTEASFSVEANERICIIGRNGAGKTTLLKLLTGQIEADSGEIHRKDLLRVSQLEQQLPEASDQLVYDVVLEGLSEQKARIQDFEQLSAVENKNAELRHRINVFADGTWLLLGNLITISALSSMYKTDKTKE